MLYNQILLEELSQLRETKTVVNSSTKSLIEQINKEVTGTDETIKNLSKNMNKEQVEEFWATQNQHLDI